MRKTEEKRGHTFFDHGSERDNGDTRFCTRTKSLRAHEVIWDTCGQLYMYLIDQDFRGLSEYSVDIAFGVRTFVHYSVRTLADPESSLSRSSPHG